MTAILIALFVLAVYMPIFVISAQCSDDEDIGARIAELKEQRARC